MFSPSDEPRRKLVGQRRNVRLRHVSGEENQEEVEEEGERERERREEGEGLEDKEYLVGGERERVR